MISNDAPSPRAGRKTVLVVEDDADVRETVAELLGDEGYHAVGAPNGAAALEALRGGLHPDVILLDVMMPVMDGREFRRQQTLDPQLRDIPVIVLTAHGNAQAIADELGLRHYLRKPVLIDSLLGMVDRVASGDGAGAGAAGA